MHALLAQHYCQSLRWTSDLCTVTKLKYIFRMIVSTNNTSSSVTFFNFALVDLVAFSSPSLVACISLAMLSFSAIKNLTFEVVASAYALVASANAVGCLCTSDMFTHSSKYEGDAWTSRLDTLYDFTTLCCDSSKDMLCTSSSGLSSRIPVSP